MAKPTVISTLKNLAIYLSDFSNSADAEQKKVAIKDLFTDIANFGRADLNLIYFGATLDSAEAEQYIEQILEALGIPKIYHGRFRRNQITLSDFLKEIKELSPKLTKRSLISALQDRIKERISLSWRNWILFIVGCFLGIESVVVSLYITSGMAGILSIIASPLIFPLAGVIGGLGYLAFFIYKRYVTQDITYNQKIRDIASRVLQSALNILAYVLSLTAVIAASPALASFFITARGIAVINQVANLLALDRPHPLTEPAVTLDKQEENLRLEFNYKKKRNNILINVVGTLLILGVVTASFFIPGFAPLIAGLSFAIVMLLHIGTYLAQRYNENKMNMKMNKAFAELEESFTNQFPTLINKQSLEDSTKNDYKNSLTTGSANIIQTALSQHISTEIEPVNTTRPMLTPEPSASSEPANSNSTEEEVTANDIPLKVTAFLAEDGLFSPTEKNDTAEYIPLDNFQKKF